MQHEVAHNAGRAGHERAPREAFVDVSSSDEMSDFIEDDSASECDNESYKTEESSESEGEVDESDHRAEDLPPVDDGVDAANIVHGKRSRKPVTRFTDQIFKTEEYRKMMLCDVPQEEINAALIDSDFTDGEESTGDPYEESDDATATVPKALPSATRITVK